MNNDKKLTPEAAVAEVRSGMLVGLGTGSTAAFAIDAIGRRAADGLRVRAVATSVASAEQARRLGIEVLDFADVAAVDLTIDGADEVDPALNLIKGGGGALLREKIVAQASAREVIVIDASKCSERLGTHHRVPVEVVEIGLFCGLVSDLVIGTPSGVEHRTRGETAVTEPHGDQARAAGG